MKKCRLILLFIIIPHLINCQVIQVNKLISENKLTTYQNQKLILIDFWATWCAPCVHATKQLEFIQEQVPDMIYMVSLSDENNDLIKDFLVKKPIELAVASDLKGQNIAMYNIESRPYCVILDYKGKLLWQGKPSELKIEKILQLYHKVKGENSSPLNELIVEYIDNSKNYQMTPDDSILMNSKEIKAKLINKSAHSIGESKTSFNFNGTLKKLTSIFLNIPDLAIETTHYSEQAVEIEIPLGLYKTETKEKLLTKILESLGLVINAFEQKVMVYELIVKSKKLLWDTDQLNWGQDSPRVLVGNDRLQGDNLTIAEVTKEISNAKGKLYIYNGNDDKEHDWDFNYFYDEFMKEELESSFGIRIDSSEVNTKFYYIENKK